MNIYEKIQTVKELLLKENLKKSGKNDYANYSYYELGDFLPSIIRLCTEQKLFTSISFDNESALLEIVNSENPEEKVIYTSPMRSLELKGCNAIQSLGGVETYSRRYLYMNAFDIVENDMFDGINGKDEKKITQQQATTLLNVLKDRGYNEEEINKSLSRYKVKKA